MQYGYYYERYPRHDTIHQVNYHYYYFYGIYSTNCWQHIRIKPSTPAVER